MGVCSEQYCNLQNESSCDLNNLDDNKDVNTLAKSIYIREGVGGGGGGWVGIVNVEDLEGT